MITMLTVIGTRQDCLDLMPYLVAGTAVLTVVGLLIEHYFPE